MKLAGENCTSIVKIASYEVEAAAIPILMTNY
jgi:hypothetical protein